MECQMGVSIKRMCLVAELQEARRVCLGDQARERMGQLGAWGYHLVGCVLVP